MVTDYIFLIISLFLVVFFICKNEIKIEKFENSQEFDNQEYLKITNRNQKFLDDDRIKKYAKLYYDYPRDINNTYKKFDKSVLRNSRVNPKINTYSQELKSFEVNKIIKEIPRTKQYSLKKNEEFGEHFTNLFNYLFSKLKMENQYHKNDKRKYKMVDYRSLINKIIYSTYSKIVYEITIFKEDKNEGFVFQNTLKFNLKNNTIFYLNIDLVGIKTQDSIVFSNKDELIDYKCKFNFNIKDNECFKLQYEKGNISDYNFLSSNTTKEKELSNNYMSKHIEKYFEDLEKEKEINEEYKTFKCFNNVGFNKSSCQSYNFEKKINGTWDRPCKNNNECPFYKKNKNYSNSRGGCKKGYCEMPINIERIGYRNYDENKEPLCYNCNIKNCLGEECYKCCKQQEDRLKYPKLKSPDYIFKNDYLER